MLTMLMSLKIVLKRACLHPIIVKASSLVYESILGDFPIHELQCHNCIKIMKRPTSCKSFIPKGCVKLFRMCASDCCIIGIALYFLSISDMKCYLLQTQISAMKN